MNILVIDDEQTQRDILSDILSDAGYQVRSADSGKVGLEMIFNGKYPMVLTDLKMPGIDGLKVLQEALSFDPDIQVVLMTAFGTIPSAVNAIKNGAYDYLTKPFQKEELLRVIGRAAEKVQLLLENRSLKQELEQRFSYHNLIGASPAMNELFRLIDRIKNIDTTVLISGESGTGKELVAKAIHFSGHRKSGPFIALNCGAIPETLIESELFGHEKGAFTGATQSHRGKFEQAQNGTIFLDEIGAMPLQLQSRLLRVLQEKKIEKIGSHDAIDLDVRVIAATNERLQHKIHRNEFRMDLFHRLNVFSLTLPPLRDRKGDIPILVKHFLAKFAKQYQKTQQKLSADAFRMLENYQFPGNVRELENIIEKTVILTDDSMITRETLMMPEDESQLDTEHFNEKNTLPQIEHDLIVNALRKNNGSIKQAATELGLTYKTLQYRMKKYGLEKENFRV